MKYTIGILVGLVALSLIYSCKTEDSNLAPDVSGISAPVELIRYDRSLAAIDSDQVEDSYLDLLTKHPNLTDLYFKQLTNLYDQDEEKFYDKIKQFATDTRITTLADTVDHIYKDTKGIEAELSQAIKFLKHYFPSYDIPRFYTLFSEFSYQTFIFEDNDGKDAIGLGLDLFLGEDFDYKKIDPSNPAFSAYLTRRYNKDHLVKKAIEMLVEDLVGQPKGKRFIDLMIIQGKKQFILDKLLPHSQDSVKWEYAPAQLAWVYDNELEIWDFFLDNEMIYETSHLKTSKYLQPAPHSKGMPDIAPGRTAVFIGYKIVSAYMKRYPETSLRNLINLNEAQQLLEKSKYKPARK